MWNKLYNFLNRKSDMRYRTTSLFYKSSVNRVKK